MCLIPCKFHLQNAHKLWILIYTLILIKRLSLTISIDFFFFFGWNLESLKGNSSPFWCSFAFLSDLKSVGCFLNYLTVLFWHVSIFAYRHSSVWVFFFTVYCLPSVWNCLEVRAIFLITFTSCQPLRLTYKLLSGLTEPCVLPGPGACDTHPSNWAKGNGDRNPLCLYLRTRPDLKRRSQAPAPETDLKIQKQGLNPPPPKARG